MTKPNLPQTIYKYVSHDSALKILTNGTLRVGRPEGMNDPFDIYIDDLFNNTLEEIQRRSIPQLIELLESDPDRFASLTGASANDVRRVFKIMASAPPPARAAAMEEMCATDLEKHDPELAEMRKAMEPELRSIQAQFRNTGIFCATRNNDNLLMWAHYADQHRGAVIGFRPDVVRDSFFVALEPVRYSDVRPTFYQPIDDMITKQEALSPEAISELRRMLVYSKSTHWAYEEELRVVIPNYIPDGQDAKFLRFYPTEFSELYLGCRMTSIARASLIEVATALNRNAAIFDVRPDKETYRLVSSPIK